MTKPLYFYNGTTFELVGPTTPQSPIAYQTSAPTAPATGDLWIDSDGDVDTYNRQLTRYYFVATAGQTSVSGVDANGLTLAYVAGSEQVYVNGALQVRGQDYTATNGTSITGLTALALNDVVEIFAYTAFTVGDIIPKSTIQAKGDLLAGTANTTVGRLAVGTANQLLAVDSSTATGLKWANPGLTLINTTSFSTVSAHNATNVFSSTYSFYRVELSWVGSTTSFINMRFRENTTDKATGYFGTKIIASYLGGSVVVDGAVNNGTNMLLTDHGSTNESYLSFDIFVKSNNDHAVVSGTGWDDAVGRTIIFSYKNSAMTDCSGFSLIPNSGTITGKVNIYGYN